MKLVLQRFCALSRYSTRNIAKLPSCAKPRNFQIYLGERTGQGEQKSSLCTFANKASQGFI